MVQKECVLLRGLCMATGVVVALASCLAGCGEADSNEQSVGDGTAGGAGRDTGEVGGGSVGGGTSSISGGGALGDAAAEFVAATNAVRAAVTQPAGYEGTWEPLPDVTWSDVVAASAQSWTDHLADTEGCDLEHESQVKYGENLAVGHGLGAQEAVAMWSSEKALYTWSKQYSLSDFDEGSGHYTQLVWRDSTQIGCGSSSCGQVVVISCRYSPPGNLIGAAVY